LYTNNSVGGLRINPGNFMPRAVTILYCISMTSGHFFRLAKYLWDLLH
jgi:hypothetical protein